MKKVILILFLLITQLGFTQNPTENQKLAATCKVWGFLKYYHPKVANGEFNWDKQLFEVLPKIAQAKTNDEFSITLENWITSLGEIKKVEPILQPKDTLYFDQNFDLSWVDKNKLFSKNLSKELRFIERNRHQGKQHYVFEYHANYKFSEKSERILGFFTYWNIIEYYYPYKYIMDKKWDTTLEEMMPNFTTAQNESDFYLAMQKLTVRLNDSNVVFVEYNNRPKYYLPIICKIIDDKMIVTEILDNDITTTFDIKVGDVITKVNDKTINENILEKRNLISGSNESFFLYNIVEPILSGNSENIKLEFLVGDKSSTKTINWINYKSNRYPLFERLKTISKKERFKILDNNIGYVDMGLLNKKNINAMTEKLQSTKAIIFDMRNYPNNTWEEISKFLNGQEKIFAIYTKPDLTYPGRFKWSGNSTCGSNNPNHYKGKIVLLLNEISASQAEWTAMCFQTAGNTTIIGSQTAGADGNVSGIDYIPAFHSQFTGIGVYYPDRQETQRIGIIPDIEVKPTILGIQQGKDEVLDRAIQFIETGK